MMGPQSPGAPRAAADDAWPPFVFRIAVADDAAADRERLRCALDPSVEWRVLEGLADLDRELRQPVHLLITERTLTWGDWASILGEAHARVPALPVVVLTGSGHERLAVRALRAGAADYLRKSASDAEIRGALLDLLSPWNGPSAKDPAGVPALFEALRVGFIRTTPDGAILDANATLARMAGFPDVAALARCSALDLYHQPQQRSHLLSALDGAGVLHRRIFTTARANHAPASAEIDARSVKHALGHTLYYDALARDVTEREQRRRQLAFQAAALDRLPNGAIGVDTRARINYWNQRAEELFGWSSGEVLGRHIFDVVVPPENLPLMEVVNERLGTDGFFEFESDDVRRDGSRIRLHKWLTRVRNEAGEAVGTVTLVADLRELRRNEERLHRALVDKAAMLREIHHRVKNNLQIVSSLLSVQGRQLADPAARALVLGYPERIRVIALAHELLYQSADYERIELRPYLGLLVARLSQPDRRGAPVRLGRMADVNLGVDLAIRLGLIVNELALASASRTPRAGRIRATVELTALRDDWYEIAVRDTGHGPPTLPPLATAFAEQIHGNLETVGDADAYVRLRFSANAEPSAARDADVTWERESGP